MSRAISRSRSKSFFLSGGEVDGLVVEGEGALLRNGAEDGEALVVEGAIAVACKGEHAEDFVSINERAEYRRARNIFSCVKLRDDADFIRAPAIGQRAATLGKNRLNAEQALEQAGRAFGLSEELGGHFKKCGATFGEMGWREAGACVVRYVERTVVGIHDAHRAFDNQPVELRAADPLRKGGADPMKKIEHACLLGLQLLQANAKTVGADL